MIEQFQYDNIIDLRGKQGDIRFECPICHWSMTLKPDGAKEWTRNGEIKPQCRKDKVELIRTVIS